MGARESRSQQEAGDDDGDTTSQDYYAILEVDENASADEIRVSPGSLLARRQTADCARVRWSFFYFVILIF